MRPSMTAVWLSLALSAGATSLAQGQQPIDEEPACTASVSAHADPPMTFNGHIIGESGAQYQETDLLIPEAIPLGVSVHDDDKVFLKCLGSCTERDTVGPWTALWSVDDPELGSFVRADGTLTGGVFDADHVVFLPARDLDCGETREGEIIATVIDPCGFGTDQDMTVKFEVTIARLAGGNGATYFDVTIVPGDVEPGMPNGDNCNAGATGCCTLVGDAAVPDAPIFADLPSSEFPVNGLCVNELRPFNATGVDTDLAFIECGEPPCPSTFAQGGFCDFLEFRWEVVSGPGEFLYASGGVATRKTAIFHSDQPGEVTIRLTVDDPCLGYCGDDSPVIITKTFYVYDLRIIDAANMPLLKIENPPSGNRDEGLRVSKVTIGRQMNGCGGTTPTFAGPVPSPTDLDTYRVEFETPSGQAEMLSYVVRLKVNRAYDDALYDVPAYEKDFSTLNQGTIFRTPEHVRLVSNAPPLGQTGLNPSAIYDDEVCGDQSILVKLGDWVTATLMVDNGGMDPDPICTLELPVGRPWSEPASVERSILEGRVHWSSMFASFNSQGTTHGSWADASAYQIAKASEDWAQAGIQFRRTNLKEETQGFFNAFFMKATGPAHQNGTLTMVIQLESGAQQTVQVPVLASQSRAQIVTNVAAAIETAFSDPNLVDTSGHGVPGELGYLIVVDRKKHTVMGITNYGTTNLAGELIDAPQNFNDFILTGMEADVAGYNLKQVLGLTQRHIDTIVVPRWNILNVGTIGLTGTSELGPDPFTAGPGLYYTIFLSEQAGDGWDGDFPMTYGHELGHFLLDQGDNAHLGVNTQNLMHPAFVPFESPIKRKRLNAGQITQARQRSILVPVCVEIPERED